jgi:hypothetical protein
VVVPGCLARKVRDDEDVIARSPRRPLSQMRKREYAAKKAVPKRKHLRDGTK